MADNLAHPYNRRQVVTIDDLPDDVLLAIFDFHVFKDHDMALLVFPGYNIRKKIESWQLLVHVCRRWRGLVFASPHRLNTQLFWKPRTSARMSHVWPALPLLIQGRVSDMSVDNVVSELEHGDHIRKIDLDCYTTLQIERLWTAMQIPFPELEALYLLLGGSSYAPVPPDSFLGGSAPQALRYLQLDNIPFPGLPKLLSSATHLVCLWLIDIPHPGYISPEAMATCLSMLTSLETFQLEYQSPLSSPDQESRRSTPPTCSVLLALTIFKFKGVNEYLEELVARINTPRLFQLSATLFNDINFDTPELIRFVSRSSTFKAINKAHIFFDSQTASVWLQPQASNAEYFEVNILCRAPGWQLSSVAQICSTSSPLLSTTENLFIHEPVDPQLDWGDGIENIEWLELLLPFPAVKNLYLRKQFAPRIALALQEMTLSTLQNLYLEGFQPSESVQGSIEGFISARQLTNHPVAISVWDIDSTQEAF